MTEDFNAKIRISRVSSSLTDDFVEIRFEDDANLQRVLVARIGLEDFGNLLTGGGAEGVATIYHKGVERLNRSTIHKTIDIDYSALNGTYGKDEDAARKIASEYEVDGWIVHTLGYGNMHLSKGNGVYAATFRKYLEKGEQE